MRKLRHAERAYYTVYSVLSLDLVLSFLPTNAQKLTNNDLACSSETVVNDKRESCATLLGFEEAESLTMYDGKQDTPRHMLSVEENGSSVFFIRDSDGEV